jgi:hypothetical protein
MVRMEAGRDTNNPHAGLLADPIAGREGAEEAARVCGLAVEYSKAGRWKR